MLRMALAGMAGVLLLASIAVAQDRNAKVRNDREQIESAGNWIYNDLSKGLEQARQENRPVLVVLRCIP